MEKNTKEFKKELKKYGVFYTPIELCKELKKYIDVEKVEEVYDPACGQGNLLSVFDDDVKKYGQELFAEELEKCKANLINFEGVAADTLTDPAFMDRKFQVIFSNPPYSVAWEPKMDERFEACGVLAPQSKADYAFVLHCLHMLREDGVAVILVHPGLLYRRNAEGKIRKWIVDNNYVDRIVEVAGDKFVDTKISTAVIVLKKNRKTTDIVFENAEGKIETVKKEQIVDNNYELSVSSYIEKEDTREKIDIDQVNKELQDHVLRAMQLRLEIDTIILDLKHDEENAQKTLDYAKELQRVSTEYADRISEKIERIFSKEK